VEQEHANEDIEEKWREGRNSVEGQGLKAVWMWWFDKYRNTAPIEQQKQNYEVGEVSGG
jgi:hypothetical protein